MNRILGFAVIAPLLTLSAPAVAIPPETAPIVFPIPADASTGSCAFDVLVKGSSKGKTIQKPGGGLIAVSARTHVTATGNGNNANYTINGTFHITTDADGKVVFKATGRNLLTDPDAGVVVTSGNFTFAFDAEGNLVEGLTGKGSITDVCADLS